MNAGAKGEPGIGALLGSLATDTGTLVRQEIHLASMELGHKAKKATRQIGVVVAGGAIVHAGALALIAALVLGIGTLVPMWLSALVIGVVVVGAGGAIVGRGLKALRELDPVPQRTLEALKQDGAWVKEQIR